jgi:tetratricopeptide (TPR) repeat protein
VEEVSRKIIAIEPNDAMNHSKLGTVLAMQGKLTQAEAAYRKAIALNPKYLFDRLDLGMILEQRGEFKDSFACLQECVNTNPDSPHALYTLAWRLANCPDIKFRDPAQAIKYAKRAIELKPGDAMLWNTLGAGQYRSGDWKAAIDALNKSIQLRKGEGDSWKSFFLAMAYWQLGEKKKARDFYDQAVVWMAEHDPQADELKRLRGEAAELLGIPKTSAVQKDKE